MEKIWTKKEAIIYIEKEIDMISNEETTNGWTRWGIFTAIASIFWIFLSILEQNRNLGIEVVYTCYSIILFLDISYSYISWILKSLYSYIHRDLKISLDSVYNNRFKHISDYISFGRYWLEVVKGSFFIAISWILFRNHIVSGWNMFVVLMNILGVISLTIIAFWNIAITPSVPKKSRTAKIFNFFIWLCISFYFFGITKILLHFRYNWNITLWKICLLVCAIYGLFYYYYQCEHNTETKKYLLSIRRNLFTQKPEDINSLIEIIEIVLWGYTADQILQKNINLISGGILEIESETHNLYTVFMLLDKLTKTKTNVCNSMDEIQKLAEQSQEILDKIIPKVDALRNNQNRLIKIISLHVSLNPSAYADFQNILAVIKDKENRYLEKLKKAGIKIHQIAESVAKVRSNIAKAK